MDSQNFEPNLALDLEIADLINSKKGTALVEISSIWQSADNYRPREAAVAIVNHINHRNPNVSLLALTVCCSDFNSLEFSDHHPAVVGYMR